MSWFSFRTKTIPVRNIGESQKTSHFLNKPNCWLEQTNLKFTFNEKGNIWYFEIKQNNFFTLFYLIL